MWCIANPGAAIIPRLRVARSVCGVVVGCVCVVGVGVVGVLVSGLRGCEISEFAFLEYFEQFPEMISLVVDSAVYALIILEYIHICISEYIGLSIRALC